MVKPYSTRPAARVAGAAAQHDVVEATHQQEGVGGGGTDGAALVVGQIGPAAGHGHGQEAHRRRAARDQHPGPTTAPGAPAATARQRAKAAAAVAPTSGPGPRLGGQQATQRHGHGAQDPEGPPLRLHVRQRADGGHVEGQRIRQAGDARRLPVDQVQPAAPKICTPTKMAGMAISTISCVRSRTIRRRSLLAAVRARAAPRNGRGARPRPRPPLPSRPDRRAGRRPRRGRAHTASETTSRTSGRPRHPPGPGGQRRGDERARREGEPVGRAVSRAASLAGSRSTAVPTIQRPPATAPTAPHGDPGPASATGAPGGPARLGPRTPIAIPSCTSAEIAAAINHAAARQPPDQRGREQHREQEQRAHRIGQRVGDGPPRDQRAQPDRPGQQKLVLGRARPQRFAARGLGRPAPERQQAGDHRQRGRLPARTAVATTTAKDWANSPTYATEVTSAARDHQRRADPPAQPQRRCETNAGARGPAAPATRSGPRALPRAAAGELSAARRACSRRHPQEQLFQRRSGPAPKRARSSVGVATACRRPR